MELVLILVGVAVVFISAMLVFFISLSMMRGSSYEDIAAEKTRRQEEIERELGIVRTTRDVKKELNKKKKEKKVKPPARELEQPEESDEQDSGLDIIETSAQRKGKKSQKIASSNAETTRLVEKTVVKADSKKKPNAGGGGGGGVKNTKAKTSGKGDSDAFGAVETAEAPFIVAEGRNKKKKQTAAAAPSDSSAKQSDGAAPSDSSAKQSDGAAPSDSSAKQTAAASASKSVSSSPRDQAKPKISVGVSTGKQNTPTSSNSAVDETRSLLPDASEWTTKQTKSIPLTTTTKRQTDAGNEELDNLKEQLATASKRFADVCQQLSTVRQNYAALEGKAQNEVAEKVKEIEALKTRLSQTHAQQPKEPSQPNKQPSKGPTSAQQDSGEAQLIQILTEENRKLKLELTSAKARPGTGVGPSGGEDLQQKVQFMDDALKQNALLLNASENSKRTIEAKLRQAEDKLNKMDSQMIAAEKKAQAGNEELKVSQAKIKSLSNDLDSAKQDLANSQNLLSKLQNEEKRTIELEEKVTSMESQFRALEQLIKQKDKELEMWKEKNCQLTEDLSKNNETLQNLEEQNKRSGDNEGKTAELNSEVKRLEEELKASEASKAKLESKLNESKQQQNKLQAELVHYQTVLADTEQTLIQIQTSVEYEERSWQRKLSLAEDQLQVSQDELKQLQEELDELSKKHESGMNHVEGSSVDTKQTSATS